MSRSRSASHSRKRHKLDDDAVALAGEEGAATSSNEEFGSSDDCCTICLQPINDRTVIPTCSHEFCFECLLLWTEQSRRCPLCSQNIGEYLIHSIRSRYDYRKRYLAPLRTSPAPLPSQSDALMQDTRQRTRRRRQDRVWGTRERGAADELDKLERSISKRRWIYEHNLFAKHVASNAYTKYRPYPTPAQFAASQDLISRTTTFLRRELQIWQGLDVEFLTTLIISLMKSIDIRSESAVRLISEFLDMDESGGSKRNAEHFTHEVYSYVRSPYRDLFVYDNVVQYDSPFALSPPVLRRSRRWRHLSDQSSSLRLSNDHSEPPNCRRRSYSSTQSSPRSPSREHRQSISHPEPEEGPENNLDQEWNNHEIHRNSLRSSTPTSRRTSSPVPKSAKGKEPEATRTRSPEISPTRRPSNRTDFSTRDIGENIAEPSERSLKSRPPRNHSLLETVKSYLAKNPSPNKPRDFKLAPTGSRHASTHDADSPVLLARLSDQDPSTGPDSQTPSIVLPAASGDGGRPLPEKSSATLDTMEARARLLARLNREKRLHVDGERASSELTTHGSSASPELETREASLKKRARLYSRLAAEKRAVSVSDKF